MALSYADFLRVPFINLLNPGSQWRESVVKLWIFQLAFQYPCGAKKKLVALPSKYIITLLSCSLDIQCWDGNLSMLSSTLRIFREHFFVRAGRSILLQAPKQNNIEFLLPASTLINIEKRRHDMEQSLPNQLFFRTRWSKKFFIKIVDDSSGNIDDDREASLCLPAI